MTFPCPVCGCEAKDDQVAALMGELEKWLAAPSDIRDGAIWKRSDGLVAETDTLLANLPDAALKILEKAQGYDAMEALAERRQSTLQLVADEAKVRPMLAAQIIEDIALTPAEALAQRGGKEG